MQDNREFLVIDDRIGIIRNKFITWADPDSSSPKVIYVG